MSNLKRFMDRALSAVCAVMFSFMTVVAVYQVVTRYVFNSPSSFSEELLTYSFAWMSMFAATLVFGEQDHMRLAYFADKLSPKNRIRIAILTECVILAFTVLVLIYGGVAITKLTLTQVTASLGISMGAVYSIMPISGVLTAIYSIINISNLCGELKAQ